MATNARLSVADVVLVPFPFTDQSGTKAPRRRRLERRLQRESARRCDHGHHKPGAPPLAFGEAMVTDCKAAGLIKASMPKPVFTTVERGLVLRTIGALSAADAKTLREVLADVISTEASHQPLLPNQRTSLKEPMQQPAPPAPPSPPSSASAARRSSPR